MTEQGQFALDFSRKHPPEVQARIADGMKAADDHADEKWKHVFDACVLAAARNHRELTSDDVLDEIEKLSNPPDTHNLSAIGPAMKRACKMKIIRHCSPHRMEPSRRPEKHGRHQTVWESLYYQARQAS